MSLVSYGGPPSHFDSLGPPSFVTPTFLPSSNSPWQYPPSFSQIQVTYPPALPGLYGSCFQPPPSWATPQAPYSSAPAWPVYPGLFYDDDDEDDDPDDRPGYVMGKVLADEDDEDDEEYFEKPKAARQSGTGQSRSRKASSRRRPSRRRSPSPPLEIEDFPKNSITFTAEQLQQLISAVAAQRPSAPFPNLLLEARAAPAQATLPTTSAVATPPAASQQLVTIPPTVAAAPSVAESPAEVISGTELVPYTGPYYHPLEGNYPETDLGLTEPSLAQAACTAVGSAIGATARFPLTVACAVIPPLVEGYSWALGTLTSGICQLADSASGDNGWFKAIKDGAAGSVAGTGSWWSGACTATATRSDKWKNRLWTRTGRSQPKAPGYPVANWVGGAAAFAYHAGVNAAGYTGGAVTSGCRSLSSALVRPTVTATPQQTAASTNIFGPAAQGTTFTVPRTTAQAAPQTVSQPPPSVRSTTRSKWRNWLGRKLSRSRSRSR